MENKKFTLPDSSQIANLTEVCLEAGEVSMQYFNKNKELKIKRKQDNSPVSNADILLNDFLQNKLQKIFPTHNIISEEGNKEIDKSSNYNWYIDPIDGTYQFIKQNDNFCINLGLTFNELPIFGILYSPASYTLWLGGVDISPYRQHLNKPNSKTILTCTKAPKNKHIAISASTNAINQLISNIDKIKEKNYNFYISKCNSAIKYMFLCEGLSHISIGSIKHIKSWDVVAPYAIIQSAGGNLIHPTTKQIKYSDHITTPLPVHICVCTKDYNWKDIIKILQFA